VEGNDFAQLNQWSLIRLTFSTPATVNANTRYWIVATCIDVANNGYAWLFRNANVYGGGFAASWANNIWTAQNDIDMMFDVLVWPDVVETGENWDDGFGFSVDGAGDPNNDTVDDVIVGAPYNDAGGNDAGKAYVFDGSVSMADNIFASVVYEFPPATGAWVNARFSRAQSFTTPAGGVTLTHVWWAGFEAQVNPGALTISLQTNQGGTPSGVNLWTTNLNPGVNPAAQEAFWLDLELSPNLQLQGNTLYWIVASNNNAHPNGYAWYIQDNNPYPGGAGALFRNNWALQGGRDLLFMVRAHADARITGGSAGDQFGHSVTGAGDIDGDGTDDVAIGAPYADNGSVANCGAVYTFMGNLSFNNMAGNANFTNYGEASNDHFGWAVDSGDFNDDGYSDILVGAPGYDQPAADAGQASIWSIPEFSDLMIPLAGVAIIYIVIRRRSATRRAGTRRGRSRTRSPPRINQAHQKLFNQ
jgi:hypothetical protein